MNLPDIVSSLSGLSGGAAALVVIAIVLWRDSSADRRLAAYTSALEKQVQRLSHRVVLLENVLRGEGLPIPIPEPDLEQEGATP